MGRSEAEARCKKHPLHRQSPGVCSSCLTERLSTAHHTTINRASSSSSFLSSSPCSSCSSSYHSPLHQRFAKGPVLILTSGNTSGFFTGKSVAFAPVNREGEATYGRKKGGFWSKLFSFRKMKEVLKRSRTLRERFSSHVY